MQTYEIPELQNSKSGTRNFQHVQFVKLAGFQQLQLLCNCFVRSCLFRNTSAQNRRAEVEFRESKNAISKPT